MAPTSTPTTDEASAAGGHAAERPVAPFAAGPVVAIAAVAGASMLAFATRYGYHRDELYFIAGGERLEGGYVDHPPLTPLVARLADEAFGQSLIGLRALTALLVILGTIATALLARELGGRRTAQVLAAFAVAASPILRGNNLFFGTTGFDQLMWALVLLLAARLLRTRNLKLWVGIGLTVGIGLEIKTTILFLVVGLLAGFAIDRQWGLLRSGWFAGGVLIAVALWMPNLLWNAGHDWAMVEWNRGKNSHLGDVEMYLFFIVGLLLMSGITTLFVWLPGARWLFDRAGRGRPFRSLGIAAAIIMAALFVIGAKYYYAAPIFVLLFAAGAVALEHGARPTRVFATWMVALSILLCAPSTMPLLPAGELDTFSALNRDYPAMVGWPELTEQVRGVARTLTPDERAHLIVLTANYGEAAAIHHFAPELAVYSGHNSYWLWGPPPDTATNAILVGYPAPAAERLCRTPQQVATVTNDAGLDNYEQGQLIWLCRGLNDPWSRTWPTLRQYA